MKPQCGVARRRRRGCCDRYDEASPGAMPTPVLRGGHSCLSFNTPAPEDRRGHGARLRCAGVSRRCVDKRDSKSVRLGTPLLPRILRNCTRCVTQMDTSVIWQRAQLTGVGPAAADAGATVRLVRQWAPGTRFSTAGLSQQWHPERAVECVRTPGPTRIGCYQLDPSAFHVGAGYALLEESTALPDCSRVR